MEHRELTPEDSLAIISNAINNFKVNYRESSRVFLLWGWILSVTSLCNFIVLKILHMREAYALMGFASLVTWGSFMVIGFAILFFMERKSKRTKKVYSHLDVYVNRLWWAAVASFFVATFLCIRLNIAPPPFMLLIAGLATTTTGLLIKFRPLAIGGASFFGFSIASTFLTNEYLALLVTASIVVGYLIPGYMLKATK